MPHTTRVTRHTSHVTSHTPHATRHKSHATRHTSHATRHTPHVTRHTSPSSASLHQKRRASSTRSLREPCKRGGSTRCLEQINSNNYFANGGQSLVSGCTTSTLSRQRMRTSWSRDNPRSYTCVACEMKIDQTTAQTFYFNLSSGLKVMDAVSRGEQARERILGDARADLPMRFKELLKKSADAAVTTTRGWSTKSASTRAVSVPRASSLLTSSSSSSAAAAARPPSAGELEHSLLTGDAAAASALAE